MKVCTQEAYNKALNELEVLSNMDLGETQLNRIKILTQAVAAYEETNIRLPIPDSLVGMIELRMFQKKLKQKDLADILGEPSSRISELLNGKKKVNMSMAKKLYEKLDIPAEFLLQNA